MSTEQIFRLYNFHLLNEILNKDFGVIECSSISNPNAEVFHQPLKIQIMAVSNRRDKKQVPDMTIFEEQKKAKLSAKKVLEIAKQQEAEKIKDGHRYVSSPDGKTMWITKIKK